MNILYISDSYLSLSVFMSQVHTLCNYHSELNQVKLIALCNHRDVKLDKPSDAKYELIKIYRYPKMFIPLINKLRASTISNEIKKELEWADVVHCRGHVGSIFAINLLNKFNLKKPVISDIRGAIVEERESKRSKLSNFYSMQSRELEKAVFKSAHYFFFVSDNMQKYYREKYNFKQGSAVFPTIVNEHLFYKCQALRNKYRDKLGIKDRFTYVYVGGADHWQNVDKMILKFNKININKPNMYFFIILTCDVKFVKKFCMNNDINVENFYIDSVAYSDVCKYLNASDYGVIIREENIMNYVASPTKINEYLACQLKVIDALDQIGINQRFLSQGYKSIKKIVKEQNDVFLKLK